MLKLVALLAAAVLAAPAAVVAGTPQRGTDVTMSAVVSAGTTLNTAKATITVTDPGKVDAYGVQNTCNLWTGATMITVTDRQDVSPTWDATTGAWISTAVFDDLPLGASCEARAYKKNGSVVSGFTLVADLFYRT